MLKYQSNPQHNTPNTCVAASETRTNSVLTGVSWSNMWFQFNSLCTYDLALIMSSMNFIFNELHLLTQLYLRNVTTYNYSSATDSPA